MGRLFLTERDREILEEWRRGSIRVLDDVQRDKYREPTGKVIVVPCADGHQMFDICKFQVERTAEGTEPMVHILSLNGGPLLLAPNSPLLEAGDTDDKVLLKHIGAANSIKGTPTVILKPHAPCGAAQAVSLSVIDVVELLIGAKQRMREHFPLLQVVPKLHVDWAYREGELDTKKSYFLSRENFEEWKRVAA